MIILYSVFCSNLKVYYIYYCESKRELNMYLLFFVEDFTLSFFSVVIIHTYHLLMSTTTTIDQQQHATNLCEHEILFRSVNASLAGRASHIIPCPATVQKRRGAARVAAIATELSCLIAQNSQILLSFLLRSPAT